MEEVTFMCDNCDAITTLANYDEDVGNSVFVCKMCTMEFVVESIYQIYKLTL